MLKKINFGLYFNKIKQLLGENKKRALLVLACLIVLILIVAYLFYPKNNTSSKMKTNTSQDEYICLLESKLEEMILSLSDVSFAEVFVMTDGSPKTNYLVETTETEITNSVGSTKTISSKVVYQKANGETMPIIVSTSYPEVLGVMVVTNAISASTKNSIKNSISIVLNIDIGRISILQEW